ncbi:MAG: hypothetical protein M0R06_05265 [Sphaerochaeta sp.]|jgi:hypothetical protein|nr:hypothetical protein [Sphaerochaeta sp.]
MAEETTTPVAETSNPQADAADSTAGNDTPVVSAEGLLNEEAFADDSLKAAAKEVNGVLSTRLQALAAREAELAGLAKDAESYRALASDPNAVKYLYERTVGATPPTAKAPPATEPTAELELDDDLPVDGVTFKKLAQALATQTKQTVAKVAEDLRAEIATKVTPLSKAAESAQKQAAWVAVVKQFPDADTPEYRKQIAAILGSGRVRPGDFEAAYHIANSSLTVQRKAETKATTAARNAKAGAAAAKAAPTGKRVDAGELSGKGGGWDGAINRAAKRVSSK